MNPILQALQQKAGIHFMGVNADLQKPGAAASVAIAMDAQPQLVTTSNSGIPAFLSTYIDPKVIETLVTPMRAAEIAGLETRKGDWTTRTAMFPIVESTGEVASYGDFSNNGRAGANVNYPERDSYGYQVVTQWGEQQLEVAALGRIDWANRVNNASVLTLNKYQNKTYFYGVLGLRLYGLLNDPNLPASISPLNVGGQTTWAQKDALGVYGDIQALYQQAITQAAGLVTVDMESPMTLAMPTGLQPQLKKATQYNVSVEDLVKKNFPNLTIKTAPEYATQAGNLMQLIFDEVEGQRTVEVSFTEKLRAHPVIIDLSSFKQKKSQGTWGAIIYRPFLIASMLGM